MNKCFIERIGMKEIVHRNSIYKGTRTEMNSLRQFSTYISIFSSIITLKTKKR